MMYAAYNNPVQDQDFTALHDAADSIMDINQDGEVNIEDAKALIKRRKVKQCLDCGKPLKKKSKYGTGLCVECYRNPPEHKLCKATVASGTRCKRRISSESKDGYCGIHMRKHEKTQ